MKSRILLLVVLGLAAANSAFAQNTYPWPASGNVGIGTLNPTSALEVNGSITANGLISFVAKAPQGYWGFNHSNFYAGQGGNVYNVGFSSGAIGIFNGSTTAEDVFLFNRNNPAGGYIVLKANNNVGIGTVNPDAKLHIVTGSDSSGIVWGAIVNNPVNANVSGYGVGLKLQNSTGSGGNESYKWAGIAAVAGSGWSNQTDLVFYTNNFDQPSNLTSDAVERVRIQANTGNVGIGTSTPLTLLHLARPNQCGVTLENTTGTYDASIGYKTPVRTWYVGQNCVNPSTGCFNIFDGSAWATRFLIDTSGNVGIGTTSPTEKLCVNGKIRAKEVIVETTGWSDNVFADSYRLQPLSEVEQHIKAEKHLPGVPSAQEVAEKGVSVGDMQAILLAKIEELTLHQIALEKLVKAQAEEIESLKVKTAGK